MSPSPSRLARRTALAIAAAEIGLTVAGALAVHAVAPSLSVWGARLTVVALLAGAVTALLGVTGGWRDAGFGPARSARLLVVPVLVALAPLVGGVRLPSASLLAVLVAGYALTGFVEEALFRGVLLATLRPTGTWPAVLGSSALFAAAHLPNMLFGQAPAVTLAQAVGTFCFGVGYAALRLRTGSVLPLMAAHFATDLVLRLDTLPTWAHWTAMVGGDTVLLLYGLLLLRATAVAPPRSTPGTAASAAVRGDHPLTRRSLDRPL